MKKKILLIVLVIFTLSACVNKKATDDSTNFPNSEFLFFPSIMKFDDFKDDALKGYYDGYKYVFCIFEIVDENVKEDEVLVDFYDTRNSDDILNIYIGQKENITLSIKANEENAVLKEDGEYFLIIDQKDEPDLGLSQSDEKLEFGKHYVMAIASRVDILNKYGQ